MSQRRKKIFLFAGGGTGGHLYPAIALGEALKNKVPDSELHFTGTKRGLEARVIPQLGYNLHLISIRGVARKLTLKNLVVPFQVLLSFVQCSCIILKIKPDVVIGTGGYVSGPMLFMALLLRRYTVIQEQNSYPGVTTRILARWVKQVHLSFKDSVKYFKNKDNIIISGNPVRQFDLTAARKKAEKVFQFDLQKPVLLVFGGSQGAAAINEMLLKNIERLMQQTELNIIWSTGKTGYSAVKEKTEKFKSRIWVSEFIDDMAMAYSVSNLAVTRAGAMTLAELTVAGLPSILIPYPYAAAGHQEANARSLEKQGAAHVLLQSEPDADNKLFDLICSVLNETDTLNQMSKASKNASFPKATETIVNNITRCFDEKGGNYEN